MLMKPKTGNSRKQPFADHVAGQVKNHRIAGAARDVFRCGFEMKFSNIDAAQKPPRKLSLIYKFLAALKRQQCSRRLLCPRRTDEYAQDGERQDRAQDEIRPDKANRAHLK